MGRCIVVGVGRELAENEDRSFSQYINLILKDFLKKRGENTRQKP